MQNVSARLLPPRWNAPWWDSGKDNKAFTSFSESLWPGVKACIICAWSDRNVLMLPKLAEKITFGVAEWFAAFIISPVSMIKCFEYC